VMTTDQWANTRKEMIEETAQVIRERMWHILHSERIARTNQAQPEGPDSLGEPAPPPSEQRISSSDKNGFVPWVLEEWRRFSIPQWRSILSEAEASGDSTRADYAIWMLREVLRVEEGPR
jgi:hypothetical protein